MNHRAEVDVEVVGAVMEMGTVESTSRLHVRLGVATSTGSYAVDSVTGVTDTSRLARSLGLASCAPIVLRGEPLGSCASAEGVARAARGVVG